MIRWMLKVSSLPDPTGREDSQPQKVIQRSDCHHTESGDHQSRLMHGFRSCLCHLYTSWRLYHLAYAHQAPNTSFEHFRRCEWTFYCLLISVLSHYLVHFSIKRDNRVVLSHTGEICWIWISKSRYYFVEVVQTTLSPDFPSIKTLNDIVSVFRKPTFRSCAYELLKQDSETWGRRVPSSGSNKAGSSDNPLGLLDFFRKYSGLSSSEKRSILYDIEIFVHFYLLGSFGFSIFPLSSKIKLFDKSHFGSSDISRIRSSDKVLLLTFALYCHRIFKTSCEKQRLH